MIKLSSLMERANERTIKALISIGALYVDESGIHANEPGTYPKRKIPTQTANPSGDE